MADTCPVCQHRDHEPGGCLGIARAPEYAGHVTAAEPLRCPCKANVYERARAVAQKHLQRQMSEVGAELAGLGWCFVDVSGPAERIQWRARDRGGTLRTADTGAALVRLAEKAEGQAPQAPVQEGFGW